jgi:tRNA threonylcarbamoyladenosine biosynthesis protein TsaE
MSATPLLRSGGPEETRALGERLGALLEAGDVVLLSGELGAGKTTFVQGLARGLGFGGSVSSKSFVIMGEYAGRVTLYHADLYRLEDPEQVWELGLEELSRDGVLVVEWPERAPEVLPEEHLLVEFVVLDEDRRELGLEAKGERAGRILAGLGERAVP